MKIDRKLTYKILPSQVIVKNFVKNERNCNYEVYLLEILNLSDYFRVLSLGEEYIKPISEENGQFDAISERYSIDFKLFIAESLMEGKSILSYSITKYSDGFYGYGASKARNKKEMTCTNLCQAIRYLTLEELEGIERNKKRTFLEKDIASFLDVLRTKKNILLFYPYEFFYEGEYVETEAIKKVMNALHVDLKESLLYRERNVYGFDTYMVTIFVDKFIIFKMDYNGYQLVDTIDTRRVKTFESLMQISLF